MRPQTPLSKIVLQLSDVNSRTPGFFDAEQRALLRAVDLGSCSPLLAARIRRVLEQGTAAEKTRDAVLLRLARGGLPAPGAASVDDHIQRLETGYRPVSRRC